MDFIVEIVNITCIPDMDSRGCIFIRALSAIRHHFHNYEVCQYALNFIGRYGAPELHIRRINPSKNAYDDVA